MNARDLFTKGLNWEAQDADRNERERKLAWRVAGGMGVVAIALGISLACLAPFRRDVPYILKVDQLGNTEVLQAFDNRLVGTQELMDKFWANRYVLAREQYNWWLVGGDNDFVIRTTDGAILHEYTSLFQGVHAMDKEFGADVDRKIKILSITPSPTLLHTMVIRFERTTISKGMMVEPPTNYVVNMSFRYTPKTFGAEVDLLRNPMGYKVYAYRRDPEIGVSSAPSAASSPAGMNSVDVAASGVVR
jgi:type IV secretion system protein VirB8